MIQEVACFQMDQDAARAEDQPIVSLIIIELAWAKSVACKEKSSATMSLMHRKFVLLSAKGKF